MCTTICTAAKRHDDERRQQPGSRARLPITSQNGMAVRMTDSTKPVR